MSKKAGVSGRKNEGEIRTTLRVGKEMWGDVVILYRLFLLENRVNISFNDYLCNVFAKHIEDHKGVVEEFKKVREELVSKQVV